MDSTKLYEIVACYSSTVPIMAILNSCGLECAEGYVVAYVFTRHFHWNPGIKTRLIDTLSLHLLSMINSDELGSFSVSIGNFGSSKRDFVQFYSDPEGSKPLAAGATDLSTDDGPLLANYFTLENITATGGGYYSNFLQKGLLPFYFQTNKNTGLPGTPQAILRPVCGKVDIASLCTGLTLSPKFLTVLNEFTEPVYLNDSRLSSKDLVTVHLLDKSKSHVVLLQLESISVEKSEYELDFVNILADIGGFLFNYVEVAGALVFVYTIVLSRTQSKSQVSNQIVTHPIARTAFMNEGP